MWPRLRNKLFSLHQEALAARRLACERVGISRYSRPARDDLDRKLQEYLPEKGFFLEAGGFDGVTASNTYYLEKIKGWNGILIEPSPVDYPTCVRMRPGAKVFNCALVPSGYPDSTVTLIYGGDLSFVEGAYSGSAANARLGMIGNYRQPEAIEVPARTLSSIIDEAGVEEIDFCSLDVEGFELQVLQGLRLDACAPRVFLIECQTDTAREQVESHLRPYYDLEAQLSHHDYLFVRRRSVP
jgi:FkbM family methyltransferase